MNNLVISLYEAYPPASGCANVTYNFAKFLHGKKFLIQFCSRKGRVEIEENFRIINFYLPTHQRIRKFMSIKAKILLLLEEIKRINPYYIFIEGASGAIFLLYIFEYLKNKGIKSTFIYHSHNVEYELRKQKSTGIITFLTRFAENHMVKNVDLATAVSKEDARKFSDLYGVNPYILPNGVDMERFENVTDNDVDKTKEKYKLKGNILFYMGLPEYKPNKEAIDFLDKNIMPGIIKEYPDIKLALIGGKVNFERKWLINPGSIPFIEVPAFIKASDICLAPIFSGSGTRLKILEYMAAGKPVVSTAKGAEGIDVKNGKNIVIADDKNKFLEKIVYILENTRFAEKIGYQGMKIIRKRYLWKKIMQNFNKTLYSYKINNQLP